MEDFTFQSWEEENFWSVGIQKRLQNLIDCEAFPTQALSYAVSWHLKSQRKHLHQTEFIPVDKDFEIPCKNKFVVNLNSDALKISPGSESDSSVDLITGQDSVPEGVFSSKIIYLEPPMSKLIKRMRLSNLTSDQKYLRKRNQNNKSSKLYRECRKQRCVMLRKELDHLEVLNVDLKQNLQKTQLSVKILKQLLCTVYQKGLNSRAVFPAKKKQI